MNKNNIYKNSEIVDHDREVGDKLIFNNNADFKY